MKDFFKLLVSITGCELVGIAATPFTIASIPTWYESLNKPIFSPPNWVFAPVWATLFFLMGISLFLIWRMSPKPKVKTAIKFFLAQLFFNFLWSILFFGLHSPILGLIDIFILWVLIFITYLKFYEIKKFAAYLLIPYLLWVSLASLLNLYIVILNF